jgi:protein-tyrosine phosphatase
MKFHEIIPGKLYQRGLMDERCIPDLEHMGVVAVANMVKPHSYELKSWLEARGGGYYYFPIPDGKMDCSDLNRLVLALTERLEQGAVVVHCRAGRNRSGLVSALIVRQYLNVTGLEAMQQVELNRPRALANEHFRDYLRSLEAPHAAGISDR